MTTTEMIIAGGVGVMLIALALLLRAYLKSDDNGHNDTNGKL